MISQSPSVFRVAPRGFDLVRKGRRPLRIEALEARIAPATLFALDDSNNLIRFDSATPGTVEETLTVIGLQAGEELHAIDFRPATGQLYALGIVEGPGANDAEGRIYTLNFITGAPLAATPVGAAPFSTTLADDANYGFDFNPTVDRIRIVSSADLNIRVHPDTGALAGTDTPLDNPDGEEEIVGSAYDRSAGGPALTTLYGINVFNNTLIRQGGVNGTPSPNLGAITEVGPLGVFLGTPEVGFDIVPGSDVAYATFTTGGVTGPTGLYTIDLATGAATLVGSVGAGATSIRGLAAATTALVVAGTGGADTLVVTATGPDTGSYSLNGGAAVPFTGITAFTFDAGAGGDRLTINNPAGSVFAPTGGIFLNGQDPSADPGDSLVLAGGGGAAFSQTYTPGATAGAGTLVTTNGTLTQTINISGLESGITDTVPAGSFEINLTAEANMVNVTDGALVGTAQTLTIGDGAGGPLTDVSFANKTLVRINGLGGADGFTLNQMAATTGLTALTLFGHSSAGTGDDDAADTFEVVTTTTATSIHAGGGDDAIVFTSDDSNLSGGTVDGGAGTDTLDYSAFTTGVAVNLGSAPGTLNAALTPDQEVPPNATSASGTATLTYNSTNRTFNVTVNVTGINPAAVSGFHIHNAAFGVNGSVIVDFVPGGTPIAPLVPTATGFTFTANNVALPALNEAALLGGATYLNIHTTPSFASGQIRGQLFASGAFTATAGTASETGGISAIENVVGSAGADSFVGSLSANQLSGNGGNDTIVGSGGADTLAGGEGNDLLVWNNGDGSDVIDGGAGTDTAQVNGSVSGDDAFSIGAGSGGRIDFDRTSLVPFSLDIGTAESLIVNGVGGNDSFTVGDLNSVADLSALSLNGIDGNDTFNLALAAGSSFPAGLALNINGGAPGVNAPNSDVVNLDVDGARTVTLTCQTGATGGVTVAGLGNAVNITAAERVNYIGDAANDDAVAVVGTSEADVFSVRPTSESAAEVFIGGTAPAAPGVSGGSLNPDLVLSGLASLQIDAGTPTSGTPGDRLAYLGNGTLASPGTGSGTINSSTGFIPVQFTGFEAITGLTPILNGGAQAFSSPTSYEVGTTPRAVATGDFNNDGFIDMVVANTASNTISILLGAGDGTFLPAVSRSSGGLKPVALAVGDFNADNALDVAVVNRGSNTVNVLNGTGTGAFNSGASVAVATGPNAIEVGNLDNDADLDIAVTSATANRVNILLNSGTGSFATPAQVATRGQVPRDLAIGDFNGDGSADIAVANSASDSIGLLLGSTNGVFTPTARFSVGDRPTSLAVADFNADGNLDIATSHAVSRFVSVLLGSGSTTGDIFNRHLRILYGAPVAPAAIAAGDFNGDGIADLALAGGKRGSFTIALGLGNGTFGPATNFPLLNFPTPNSVSIALTDFDGNGSLDVAVANLGSNDVTVALRSVV